MNYFFILLFFFAVTAVSAVAARAAWRRDWKWHVFIALLLLAGLVGLFFYLSSIATGSYLAGLVEALIAIFLAAGPGVGIILGVIAAISIPIAIGLAVTYGAVIAIALANS